MSVANEKYADDRVGIYFSQGNSITEKMLDVLCRIEKFDPDLIIDTCADYELLGSILHKFYPIIQIPMRGTNSCTYFHKSLVGCEAQFNREWLKFHSIPKDKVNFCSRYPYIPLKCNHERGCGRAKYGFAANQFLISSVGNRIGIEATSDFIDAMAKLLRKHSDIVWIIAGRGTFPYIEETYSELVSSGQIRLWGYENDLDTFFIRLDIKLAISPQVGGNGGCAYKALRCGTPVLINKISGDTEHLIGWDKMIEGDYNNLIDKAEYFYNNPQALNTASTEAKERILSLPTAKEYCEQIVAIGEDIIEKWN